MSYADRADRQANACRGGRRAGIFGTNSNCHSSPRRHICWQHVDGSGKVSDELCRRTAEQQSVVRTHFRRERQRYSWSVRPGEVKGCKGDASCLSLVAREEVKGIVQQAGCGSQSQFGRLSADFLGSPFHAQYWNRTDVLEPATAVIHLRKSKRFYIHGSDTSGSERESSRRKSGAAAR